LEAYSATCAEAGDFAEAVKWQKKVLDLKDHVESRGPDVRKRLELYEAKKPYRIPPTKPPC
jgi:hypothetical protein